MTKQIAAFLLVSGCSANVMQPPKGPASVAAEAAAKVEPVRVLVSLEGAQSGTKVMALVPGSEPISGVLNERGETVLFLPSKNVETWFAAIDGGQWYAQPFQMEPMTGDSTWRCVLAPKGK